MTPWPPREPLWWPIPWAIGGALIGLGAGVVVLVLAVRWVVG